MSRLYQIVLVDGSMYITREESKDIFFKEKTYNLRSGCIVNNNRMPNGQSTIQLFDISKDVYFDLPILIQTHLIVKVKIVKKVSDLEALYLKVTSGIIVAKGNPKLN